MDTSMGLGPLAGFPMGTRSGDVDATILEYLMGRYGYDIKEMLNILNKKSGVLGISASAPTSAIWTPPPLRATSGPSWLWTSSSTR